MFFGFRPLDLLVVAVTALLIFGPKRLPEMGSAVGKTIKEFQKSIREVRQPEAAQGTAVLPSGAAQPLQVQTTPPMSIPGSAIEGMREPLPAFGTAPADALND